MIKFSNIILIVLIISLVGIVMSIHYKKQDEDNNKIERTKVSNKFYWGDNEKYKR